MDSIKALAAKLCDSSQRHYHNIYEYVAWPAKVEPENDWFMSPELCTLFGTEVWELLDDASQKRLAFYENINFFSLNIRGETALMQGLARRLYAPSTEGLAAYLHHFLDEENKHCVLFGTFCERYANKVYPDRKIVTSDSSSDAGREDFLFFAKVLMFEEIVDRYNLDMSKDERLHPLAVAINRNHHLEESRHLAFGRALCTELWERGCRTWATDEQEAIRQHLQQFLMTTWKEYYNPDVYRDAGLERALEGRTEPRNVWQLQQYAWTHESGRQRRFEISQRCTSFLRRSGILGDAVVP